MSAAAAPCVEVLRGLHLDGEPLRLGRARSEGSTPPSQPAAVRFDEEQALQELRALSMREAREEGLRAGRADGLREGRAHAAEEIRAAVQQAVSDAVRPVQEQHDRLQQLAEQARLALADALVQAQEEMVALCYDTLCRMVGAAAVRPELVRAQLLHLLQVHGSAGVALHVHPDDAELLTESTARGAQPDTTARWVADPQVALGGCILKTSSGGLDARLETMLGACKAALLEARTQRRAQVSSAEDA
jgi:flagellar assembly protein FliH